MNKKRKLQKRGEFVPIGDIAFDLPGVPVKALSDRAPEARHHFTTLHQVDQLIEASEVDADMGFMARLLALCSLPRTNPGDRTQYIRRNGPYTLGMSAGINNKLPYGNIPRLLLAWVCTEAVRTQSRELVLGRSLYEFMHKLGMMDRSGGAHGERTRLKNQMRRLFSCSVSLIYADEQRRQMAGGTVAGRVGEVEFESRTVVRLTGVRRDRNATVVPTTDVAGRRGICLPGCSYRCTSS